MNGQGGYVKQHLIRHKINELYCITEYDKMKIATNTAQLQCMVDLEIISLDQAQATIDMYARLERRHEQCRKRKTQSQRSKTLKS